MGKRSLNLIEDLRPQTRGDCVNGVRPCPWISCRMHLYIDVHPNSGTIKYNSPRRCSDAEVATEQRVDDLFEMSETCALDVADRGETILNTSGAILNVTREAIRQLEKKAKAKFKARTTKRLLAHLDVLGDRQESSPLAYAQDRAED